MGVKSILSAAIVAVMAVILPVRQAHAQVWFLDTGPIVSAIEAFQGSQMVKEVEKAAQMVKDYKQQILEYKELVEQGMTQAKQLKQMYENAKTFTTGDLPHFMSDLKGNPIATLESYSRRLMSLAQDADQALDMLKKTNIKLNGTTYSIDELAGLDAKTWYSEVNMDAFADGKLHKDALEYASKLSAKQKAYIQEKYHMSPVDYYKWLMKTRAFNQFVSSAMASCSQWTEDAKKQSLAISGYASQIAEMGMNPDVSANEIAQMTNQLLLANLDNMQQAMSSLQQAQTASLQSCAVAMQEAESEKNREYAKQEAWRKELERSDVPSWYYTGTAGFPAAPKRDFSGSDAKSDKKDSDKSKGRK